MLTCDDRNPVWKATALPAYYRVLAILQATFGNREKAQQEESGKSEKPEGCQHCCGKVIKLRGNELI
jgi:hypothetical protein